MTPNDIIARALRLIGVLGQGNPTPSPYQEQIALISLNGLLASFSRKRLIVPCRWYFTFPLTSNKQKYTMGATIAGQPAPDFCTATEASSQIILRPIKLENAGVLLPNTPINEPFELPLAVWTDDEWAAVRLKKLTGTQIFPLGVWPDNAQNPYIQNLWFWPIPVAQCSVSLYVWQPLGQIVGNTAITSQIFLPDDYDDLLSYNLGVNVAPELNKEPSAVVVQRAQQCLDNMRASNARPLFMQCDPGMALNLQTGQGQGRYNFRTDNQ